MAEPTGFEPATSDVTGRRSNQLNYDSAFFRSEFSNLKFEIFHYWWARRDSNPQPLPCKGSRLPLTYVPFSKIIRNHRVATKCDRKERIDRCQGSLCHTVYRVPTSVGLLNLLSAKTN